MFALSQVGVLATVARIGRSLGELTGISAAARDLSITPPVLSYDPFIDPPPMPANSDQGIREDVRSAASLQDPALLALAPGLLNVKPALDPEGYRFIATLGNRFRMDKDVIADLQQAYAKNIPSARSFVSYEDQLPGLKRLVILGPIFAGHPKASHTILGVTNEGRFFQRSLRVEAERASVGGIIDTIRNGDDGAIQAALPQVAFDFNLNMRSRAWKNATHGIAHAILGRMLDESGRCEMGEVPGQFRNAFQHVTRLRFEKDLRLVRHALVTSIDTEILRAMHANMRTSARDAAWLSGDTGRTAEIIRRGGDCWFGVPAGDLSDRQRSEARLQAVRAYPLFSHVLMDKFEAEIDGREPLAPILADYCDAPDALMRRLSGLTWQRSGFSLRDPRPDIARLRRIPVDHFPRSRPEFAQTGQISRYSALYGTAEEAWATFARGGSPYRFGDRLPPVGDIRDMIQHISRKLYVPAYLHAIRAAAEAGGMTWHRERGTLRRAEETCEILFAQLGPKDLIEASERWHRGLNRHEMNTSSIKSGEDWMLLAGEVTLRSGFVAREIHSHDGLVRQGRQEGHCVGGYDGKVLQGCQEDFTLIFSIEKDGLVQSTIELAGRRETREVKSRDPAQPGTTERVEYEISVVQNRAKRNADPSPEVKEMGKLLAREVSALPPEAFDRYFHDLQTRVGQRRASRCMPACIRDAGYDVWDRAELEKAWEEFAGYLPRKVRKAGLDGFIAAMDLSAVALSRQDAGSPRKSAWDEDREYVESLRSGIMPVGGEADAPAARLRPAAFEEREQDRDEDYALPF